MAFLIAGGAPGGGHAIGVQSLLLDTNFDGRGGGVDDFCYLGNGCPGGAWSGGGAGFIRQHTASFAVGAVPSGPATAFVQGMGWIEQAFTASATGRYRIACGRPVVGAVPVEAVRYAADCHDRVGSAAADRRGQRVPPAAAPPRPGERHAARAPYGTPGASRVDAVVGPIGSPLFAIDLKTGGAFMSMDQYNAYRANLPGGTFIQEIIVP